MRLLARKLASAWRLIRAEPPQFWAHLAGRPTLWKVYAATTGGIAAPRLPQRFDIRPLNDVDWRQGSIPASIRRVIEEFLTCHKPDGAYLLFVDGRCAHISWLVPWNESKPLGIKPGEAEICGCFTDSEFRGQGLYPLMVRYLAATARENGIRRIYMKTSRRNYASQKGILKAGLRYAGSSLHFQFSYVSRFCGVHLRFYRWSKPGPKAGSE